MLLKRHVFESYQSMILNQFIFINKIDVFLSKHNYLFL